MYALLGNFNHVVEVEGMKGYVYFRASVYRVIGDLPKMEVGIAKNDVVAPVYDLPVKILDGEVIRMCMPEEINNER